MTHSWYENTARGRIEAFLDPGSFEEILPAQERVASPHLRQLDTRAAFDDGVIVGRGALGGRRVLLVARCWWPKRVPSWAARWARSMAPKLSACSNVRWTSARM